jgi:hypothetical protein
MEGHFCCSSFDTLRTNGTLPLVVSLSNHER